MTLIALLGVIIVAAEIRFRYGDALSFLWHLIDAWSTVAFDTDLVA